MPSTAHFVQLILELTQDQRRALKAIASGNVGTVGVAELGKLQSIGLIHRDGSGITLTKDGELVVALC